MAAITLATASAVAPSARPGMGTILFPGGVAFRVWAPFATEVFAAGTFNQWSSTANPFAHEGHGYWSVEVPGAKIGDEYRFVIRHGATADLAPESLRERSDQFIAQRHHSRSQFRLDGRPLHDAAVE